MRDIRWDGVVLTTSDRTAGPAFRMESSLGATATEKVAEHIAAKKAVLAAWDEFLAEEAAKAKRAEEEQAARELEERQRREVKAARKAERERTKADIEVKREGEQETRKRELEPRTQQEQKQKWANQRAATEERDRASDYKARVAKSKHRCTCGCPIQQERCRIRDSMSNRVMWPGADLGLSVEQYQWFMARR